MEKDSRWIRVCVKLGVERAAIEQAIKEPKGRCFTALQNWLDDRASLPAKWRFLLIALSDCGFLYIAMELEKQLRH